MTVLAGGRVVTPDGILADGWVELGSGRISGVGTGAPPRGTLDVLDLGGAWLLPGYVDLHMHGGGGVDVTRGRDDMAAAVAFHRGHGTTSALISLMAQPVDAMCEQLGWAAELTAAGVIAGAHLEGPFLAAARCGAQRPDSLLPPDPLVLRKLVEAGQGCIRTITVAPELPGALDLIAGIVAEGIVAAIGHTDATFEQAAAGFAAGATLTTHLFNAMGSFSQREPGPAIAALDAGVHVELINDGLHVHEALARLVARSAADRLVLVTDAISAAGVGDGTYTLGEQDVVVRDGAARLRGSSRLAGSTLTMDESVRRAVTTLGMSIEAASAAASGNPARAAGLDDRTGSITTGLAADLVVLDDDLYAARVMSRGEWIGQVPPAGSGAVTGVGGRR